MRPPGNAFSCVCDREPYCPREELHKEPKPHEQECRYLEEERKEQDWDKRYNPRAGKEPQIGGHHAGDRPDAAMTGIVDFWLKKMD